MNTFSREELRLKKAVETLKIRQSFQKEIDQLRMDFDLARKNPFNVNVWLKPSELAAILKVSNSTVTKWRNEGISKIL